MSADAAAPRPAFLWGTATSSYQIEGAVSEDGRGPSIWDVFTRVPGAIHDGHHGDVATDHYHRLEEDLDLLKWLGLSAYRFSVAWPRVSPDGSGRVNQRGLDFYRRLVDGLRARDIEPLLTLYHWDLPQALQDEGGWAARSTVDRFERYTETVVDALGDQVDWWATLNEPWCSAFLGYGVGKHAPGLRDDSAAVAAAHHLLLAHGRASAVLHGRLGSRAQVGIALNLAPIEAASERSTDVEAARIVDGGRNRAWTEPILEGRYPEDVLRDWAAVADLSVIHDADLETIAAPVDWLGINYYHPIVIGSGEGRGVEPNSEGVVSITNPGPATAMGWPIDPAGLGEVVQRIRKEHAPVPLVITENGAAFDDDRFTDDGRVDDQDRIAYLSSHLDETLRLADDGADIRGYFLWTLLDNFEWAEGYRRRFGIVAVDPTTKERRPKASADWYRRFIGGQPFAKSPAGST